MKLAIGLLAALASCAAAAQPAANVFILSRRDSSTTTSTKTTTLPSLPRSLARLLLLHRLAPIGRGPSVRDMPHGVDVETVVSALNRFGRALPPLLARDQPEEALQLVIMLEGMTEQQIRDTTASLKVPPSFTISDPPSAGAHEQLARYDFYNAGVTEHDCELDQATNPYEVECWSGDSSVARYNVKRNPQVLTQLLARINSLKYRARTGEMETTILLLPALSSGKSWSDRPEELRRRQMAAEQVITSHGRPVLHAMPTPISADDDDDDNDKGSTPINTGLIPACFSSLESCIAATGNCSRQGQCLDRFATPSSQGGDACFACHCLSTRANETGPLTHWAGPTCAKKDISVPFWLFAGFTLLMLATLSLAMSMLYSVGEEQLPGVIGAGVSKSK